MANSPMTNPVADVANVGRHLVVRNTFLESVKDGGDDDDDFLDVDFGLPRAVSEPASKAHANPQAESAVSSPGGAKSRLEAHVASACRAAGLGTGLGLYQARCEVIPEIAASLSATGSSSGVVELKPEEPVYVQTGLGSTAGSQPSVQATMYDGGLQGDGTEEEQGAKPGAGEVESRGMIGHPTSCTECQFYFFSPDGCRSGADCLFCHAIHPRKNAKKNRRHMRRLNGSSAENADEPELVSDLERQVSQGLERQVSQGLDRQVSPGSASGASATSGKAPRDSGRRSSGKAATSSSREVPPGLAACFPVPNAVLSYIGDRSRAASGVQALTFVAGIYSHLQAYLNVPPEVWKRLGDRAAFFIEPALPQGLILHEHRGHISGVPSGLPEKTSVHKVHIMIATIGPGGCVSGYDLFTDCTISVRIVDLQKFVLTSGEIATSSLEGKQEVNELILRLRPY